MIRKKEAMKEETRESMRGGSGVTHLHHLFSPEELGANSRLCARVALPPGASIGSHDHTGEREIYYILQGIALFIENGTEHRLHAGDATITGGGGVHSITNAGDVTLEFMAFIIMD